MIELLPPSNSHHFWRRFHRRQAYTLIGREDLALMARPPREAREKDASHGGEPLGNIEKSIENHHLSWVNHLEMGHFHPFSIVMLVYQEGNTT